MNELGEQVEYIIVKDIINKKLLILLKSSQITQEQMLPSSSIIFLESDFYK